MGFFSGIAKVFKKVVRTVKKVAPLVILGAAVVFTAGAALAAAGAATAATGIFGWSTALSSAIGGPGGILGNTLLGSIVSGAVTQGIIGTAIGGGLAAITGRDVTKGMLMGGIGGLLTGGVMGAINAPPALPAPAAGARTGLEPLVQAPLENPYAGAQITAQTAKAPASSGPTLSAGSGGPLGFNRVGLASQLERGTAIKPVTAGVDVAPAGSGVLGKTFDETSVVGKSGLLNPQAGGTTNYYLGAEPEVPWADLSPLGKLSRTFDKTVNTQAGGMAFMGAAQALLSDDDESRVEAARIEADESRAAREAIAGNYGGTRGLLKRGGAQQQPIADPSVPLQAGRWFWNPETRRLDYQQPATATA